MIDNLLFVVADKIHQEVFARYIVATEEDKKKNNTSSIYEFDDGMLSAFIT
jgi:hypothetical protein